MAGWVSQAWAKVTKESIVNSFKCTGITGTKEDLHPRLKRLMSQIVQTGERGTTHDEESDDEELLEIVDADSGLLEEVEETIMIETGMLHFS